MRILVLLSFLFAATAVQSAECLSVKNDDFEIISNDHGITTIEWTAEVQNQCEAPYDGRLMIDFVDANEEVLHETLEVVILQQNASQQVSKRVSMPADRHDDVETTRVVIKERERPI